MSPSRSASASPAVPRRVIQSGSSFSFLFFPASCDFSALFGASAAANYADHYQVVGAAKWATRGKKSFVSLEHTQKKNSVKKESVTLNPKLQPDGEKR